MKNYLCLKVQVVLAGLLVLSLLAVPMRSVQAAPAEFDDLDLVISEYVEGSGTDKAIEIFNPTPYPAELSEYSLLVSFDGGTAVQQVTLSGTLLYGDNFVVVDDGSSQALLDLADLVWAELDFTGDDAVVLYHQDQPVDSIGRLGEDPGQAWLVWDIIGGVWGSTQDNSLQKYPLACAVSDRVPNDVYLTLGRWHVAGVDTFSDLGNFACEPMRLPVAVAQSVTTDEDMAKPITLSGDWVTADDQFVVRMAPQRGTLSGTGANLVYTPLPNQNGPDFFEFVIVDGETGAESAPAAVTINVQAVDDQPLADAQSVSLEEDDSVLISLTGSDVETPAEALVYEVVDAPAHGTLSGTAPNLTYTPSPDYFGPDRFTFTVNDGLLNSEPAAVTLEVLSVNDLPQAFDQTVAVDEDDSVEILLTGDDLETDAAALIFVIDQQPLHGTLDIVGSMVTYQPDENYNGPDSFTFTVDDGEDVSDPAAVRITVDAVNDAPTAFDDAGAEYAVAADQVLQIAAPGVLANDSDVDGDVLQAIFVDDVQHGTLALNRNGSFTYDPDDEYVGLDSFTYRASDGALESEIVTVTIAVTAIPVTGEDEYYIYIPVIFK